jgi:hypothetical protein
LSRNRSFARKRTSGRWGLSVVRRPTARRSQTTDGCMLNHPTTTASHDLPIIKLNTFSVLKSIRTYPTRRARPQCPFVGRVARLPHTSAHPLQLLTLFLVLLLIIHLLLLALFFVLFSLVLLVHKWTQWITRGVGVGVWGGGEHTSSFDAYLHVYSSLMALHLHLHVRRRRKSNATRMARSRRRKGESTPPPSLPHHPPSPRPNTASRRVAAAAMAGGAVVVVVVAVLLLRRLLAILLVVRLLLVVDHPPPPPQERGCVTTRGGGRG